MTTGTVMPDIGTIFPIGQTALLVKCGLGHEMVQVAPVRYECRECGFTVVIFASR